MQQLALPVRHEWLAREQSYGKIAIEPFDPVTLASTSGLMIAAGVSAIWWPANRASRTNPVVSLKEG